MTITMAPSLPCPMKQERRESRGEHNGHFRNQSLVYCVFRSSCQPLMHQSSGMAGMQAGHAELSVVSLQPMKQLRNGILYAEL